jgi:methylmalonyl-CoA mutase N-terminal domain/subunit
VGRGRRARRRRVRAAISFFFNAHSDFFEEIAKYRAARKLWAAACATVRREDERSWKLRFHSQTAGVSLTAQQPYNNVVRTALQALSAVLGGTNSLHTNSLDEALALPTDEAARWRCERSRSRLRERLSPTSSIPLGGSLFVEKLTQEMERRRAYFDQIEQDGRDGRGDRARLSAEERSPRAPTASSSAVESRSASSSCVTTSYRKASRRSTSCTSTRASSATAQQAGGAEADTRQRARRPGPDACARPPAEPGT